MLSESLRHLAPWEVAQLLACLFVMQTILQAVGSPSPIPQPQAVGTSGFLALHPIT